MTTLEMIKTEAKGLTSENAQRVLEYIRELKGSSVTASTSKT
jgi:hypothetical protein